MNDIIFIKTGILAKLLNTDLKIRATIQNLILEGKSKINLSALQS